MVDKILENLVIQLDFVNKLGSERNAAIAFVKDFDIKFDALKITNPDHSALFNFFDKEHYQMDILIAIMHETMRDMKSSGVFNDVEYQMGIISSLGVIETINAYEEATLNLLNRIYRDQHENEFCIFCPNLHFGYEIKTATQSGYLCKICNTAQLTELDKHAK